MANLTPDGLSARDLEIGQVFETGSVCLTEEAITSFARDFDPQPFHLDADASKETFFGTLVASGWHVLAATMRLMVDARPFGATPLIGAELTNIRFSCPVLPDTNIMARATVVGVKNAKNPKHAYVTLLLETVNTDTEAVLVSQNWKLLVPSGVSPSDNA